MVLFENVCMLLGAITVFLCGLKIMSGGAMALSGDKLSAVVRKVSKNRVGGVLAGCICTAVMQSSIATNIVVVSFVEKGVLSFVQAAAVVMGTNIGTTVTAQLVSLSFISDFDVSAIGCLVAFIGLLAGFWDKHGSKALGDFLLGFGFIFIGLEMLMNAMEYFKNYVWFRKLFLVSNPVLLLLNGLFITAIIQSSSVVTGMMVVLASLGMLSFKESTFLILGSNIGTCISVILASAKLSNEAKKTAFFNLMFNVIGSIVFFLPLVFAGDWLGAVLGGSNASIGRMIANFHTLFNTAVCLILLPVLKPVCNVVEKIFNAVYLEKQQSAEKNGLHSALKLEKNMR